MPIGGIGPVSGGNYDTPKPNTESQPIDFSGNSKRDNKAKAALGRVANVLADAAGRNQE